VQELHLERGDQEMLIGLAFEWKKNTRMGMEKDDRRGGIYKGEALNSACFMLLGKWSGPNPTLLNNEKVETLYSIKAWSSSCLYIYIYIYIYI
jgi:hypothetical protein